jgi:hypothetical protein
VKTWGATDSHIHISYICLCKIGRVVPPLPPYDDWSCVYVCLLVSMNTTRRPGESSDDHLVDKVLPPTQVATQTHLAYPHVSLDSSRGTQPFGELGCTRGL